MLPKYNRGTIRTETEENSVGSRGKENPAV